WLLREWTAYEDELYDENQDTGTPGPEPDEIVALRATRQRLLRRVFELVENVDAARADAVRGAIAREETYYRDSAPSREVDALAGAMAAVADWLDDDAARCRWARAHADLRLTRIEHQMRSRVYFAEVEGETLPAIESAISRLERLRRTFRANPRGAAAAFPALRAPSDAAQAADVTALHEQLDAVAARCAAP
ncbi:MAG: hypothetical protein KC619_07300, partial [Myxococcales bacterium]|nr:hypothetical protein [Myxococcales bacterium]